MRLAVVGSRSFSNQSRAFHILDRFAARFAVDLIVSGGARGADTLAASWANARRVPTRVHLPDWSRHGRHAGFLRNQLIVAGADALIAFWDGHSLGTAHSIRLARERNIPVYVIKG